MSGILSMIIWFVIIYSIVKSVRKKNNDGGKSVSASQVWKDLSGENSGSSTQNKSSSSYTPSKSASESASVFTGETHSSTHSDSANGRRESKWVSDTVERHDSVTARSNHDDNEHTFTFGDNNRPSAKRLLPGDTVPAGYKVTRCGYCGADNLVKGDPCNYSCYFCRELL